MKFFIVSLLTLFAFTGTSAVHSAPHHSKPVIKHHHKHWNNKHWHSNHGWLVPALIGGSVVYLTTRPDTVVIQSPQPLAQESDQIIIDGVVYTKQTVIINGEPKQVFIRQ